MSSHVELILEANNKAQPEQAQKFSNWLYRRAANTTGAMMDLPESDKKQLRAEALRDAGQNDIAREMVLYCPAIGGCPYNEVMQVARMLLIESSELYLENLGL